MRPHNVGFTRKSPLEGRRRKTCSRAGDGRDGEESVYSSGRLCHPAGNLLG